MNPPGTANALIVDDGETPGQLGAVRARREREADLLHVALQRVVLIQPHLVADLAIGLAAHGDLLRLAQHHELARAGHRVGGAAAEHQ